MSSEAELCNADVITELDALNGRFEGLTINIAQFEGGGPLNMVPDLAICRLNVRYVDAQQEAIVQSKIEELVRNMSPIAAANLALTLPGDQTVVRAIATAWPRQGCPTWTPWAYAAATSTAPTNICRSTASPSAPNSQRCC